MKKQTNKIKLINFAIIMIVAYLAIIMFMSRDEQYNIINLKDGELFLNTDSWSKYTKNYILGKWNNKDTEENMNLNIQDLYSYNFESFEEYDGSIYSINLYSEVDINDVIMYIELFLPVYKIYVNDELVGWSRSLYDNREGASKSFAYEFLPFKIEKNKVYNIEIQVLGSLNPRLYKTPILDTFSNKKESFLEKLFISYLALGILISGFFITIIISFLVKSNRFSFKIPVTLILLLFKLFFNEENLLINNILFERFDLVFVSKIHFIIGCLLFIFLNFTIGDIFNVNKKEKVINIRNVMYYLTIFISGMLLKESHLNSFTDILIFIVMAIPNGIKIINIIKKNEFNYVKLNIFISYIFLIINIILSNTFFYQEMSKYDFSFALIITSMIFCTSLLYYWATEVKKAEDEALRVAIIEKELVEKNTVLLLSQIKPHFIYNTLATIQSMIKFNPNEAYRTIGTFSKYLRTNINSIDFTELIDIEKEIDHIKIYTEIEKIRFGERINIIYNIKSKNIKIPSLTIQPLVENSIKHGLCKKIDGGYVEINTYEDDDNFYITIIDNGIGFECNEIVSKDHSIGLKNIQYRLKELLNAELIIESKKNIGTISKIIIPKKWR